MRLGGLITLALAGALAAATSTAYAAEDRAVAVGNGNRFDPPVLQIVQGDVVNWTWVGPDTNHSTTTTAEGQTTWDSDLGNAFPNHEVGYRFSREFHDTGEFSYFCKVHADMTGKIVVLRKATDPNGAPADTAGPTFGTPTVQVKRRRVRFTLDEPAEVEAKLRGPTRKRLKLSGEAGTNVLKLPRRLKEGRYGLTMRATDAAGNKSLVARLKFRVR